MKKERCIILVALILFGCSSGRSFENHNRQKIELKELTDTSWVIYKTPYADFYFGRSDVKAYCQKENNGEHNDFVFEQILDYLKEYGNDPVIIPDTLGTKWVKAGEIDFNDSDSLIRIRDQNHPYAYVTDAIRWMTIELARKGNIKIKDNRTGEFTNTIFVDDVETGLYGETNIHLSNDSIVFSQLRWIR